MHHLIDEILQYWFGELDDRGLCTSEQHAPWFKVSKTNDERCRQRFGEAVTAAVAGELDNWADSDSGLVALTLLLDQFTRNIHRGTTGAFAGDSRAQQLACRALETDRQQKLPAIQRVFLYMPLEHSETLPLQERCVCLFTELAAEFPGEPMRGFLRYAKAHRDIIAQFGRFPHRNAILQRNSSDAELAHLKKHKGF